jgi:hypothetical protein
MMKLCVAQNDRLTQHIRFGLSPLPFETFCYRKTSYMLGTLYDFEEDLSRRFRFSLTSLPLAHIKKIQIRAKHLQILSSH